MYARVHDVWYRRKCRCGAFGQKPRPSQSCAKGKFRLHESAGTFSAGLQYKTLGESQAILVWAPAKLQSYRYSGLSTATETKAPIPSPHDHDSHECAPLCVRSDPEGAACSNRLHIHQPCAESGVSRSRSSSNNNRYDTVCSLHLVSSVDWDCPCSAPSHFDRPAMPRYARTHYRGERLG